MATKRQAAADSAAAKNQPLVDDIRLLGRILGDVIREQEGKEAFDLVERVRQLAVAYRLKRNAAAGRALDRLLTSLSGDRTVSVIRAFSYFSHLANIAEDRHHLRRRAVHERQGHLQRGSLAGRVRAAGAARHRRRPHRRDAGARLDLAGAHRPPDRGAAQEHPRRRAGDRRAAGGAHARSRRARSGAQRVADPRPRHPALADADAAPGQAHRRRRDRERAQLLPRYLPGADPASSTARSRRRCRGSRSRRFFRMGNWIGGDRDGNPFVGADTLATALARQSETALRHYLTQVHELGAELSSSATLLERVAGAAGAGRGLGRRQPAPRRRALPPRPDRRLCPAGGDPAGAHRHRRAAPCGGAEHALSGRRRRCSPTCARSRRRCAATTPRRWSAPRLAPLIRAVQVFGFHLATVDLRQSSDRHEAVIAELLAAARIEPDYAGLDEAARRACLLRRCSTTPGRCGSAKASGRRPTATRPATSWRSSRPRRRCAPATAATRSATTSSRTPRRSATCSRCWCC